MQSKNKNGSVQFSTRYQQYDFAKRCIRKESSREVFPFGEDEETHTEHERGTESETKPASAITTREGGRKENNFIVPVLTPDRPEKRQNGRRFKEDGEPSFTLTAQDKHGIYDGAKIRRLTPTECMRLQGFSDDWCDVGADGKEMSDSQKYKMAGNAVTVNVIKAIIKKL